MDSDAVTQIVTVVLAVLAIIWHQQRSTDKLRELLDSMERRLARIEGFLGIGVPAAAPKKVLGAAIATNPPEKSLFGIDKDKIEIYGDIIKPVDVEGAGETGRGLDFD